MVAYDFTGRSAIVTGGARGIGLAIAFLLGFRIELLFALLLEAIPGLGLFPSWLVAVPMIWVRSGGASTGFGASPPTAPPRG